MDLHLLISSNIGLQVVALIIGGLLALNRIPRR
jgi:hypothetical protein